MEMEHPVVTLPDLQLDQNGYFAFSCSGGMVQSFVDPIYLHVRWFDDEC